MCLNSALAYLSAPYDDQFFFSFLNSKSDVAFSAFKGLVHLEHPTAVKFLQDHFEISKERFSPETTDQAFNFLGKPIFASTLKEWLENCSDIYNRVRILVALTNAGFIEQDATYEAIQIVQNDANVGSELFPFLIRILGQFDEDRGNILERPFEK